MNSEVSTFISILRSVREDEFESLIEELLSWMNSKNVERHKSMGGNLKVDLVADLSFEEPGGMQRTEKWGFECKRLEAQRVSVLSLEAIESQLQAYASHVDVLCLVTPWRLTSLARNKSKEETKLRIWDQEVLENIAERNIEHVRSICGRLSNRISEEERKRNPPVVSGGISLVIPSVAPAVSTTVSSVRQQYTGLLASIPTGQKAFADYENAVIKIFEFIFKGSLGPAKHQSRTADETQRRDFLFKNLQEGRFWRTVFQQYGCNFLIVDAKNYEDPVTPAVINDVSKYANEGIGRYILVVSRKGGDANVEATQLRIFGGLSKVMIVVISDAQLLEMVEMKELGQAPEDLLEDATDSLVIRV